MPINELSPDAAKVFGGGPVHRMAGLSADIPEITRDDVAAVLARSREARGLKKRLDHCVSHGGVFSRREVDDLVKRAGGKNPEPNQAVVLAYFAQNHAEVFAPDAHKVVADYLKGADWPELMADLKRFMAEIAEREAEEAKKRQIQKELRDDEIKREDKKIDLKKQNGTKAERAQEHKKLVTKKAAEKERIRDLSPAGVDDELTGSGRLQLTDVEKTALGLMKKGFANKE